MDKILKDRIRQRLISEYMNLFVKDAVDVTELKEKIIRILEDIAYVENKGLSEQEKKGIVAEMVD